MPAYRSSAEGEVRQAVVQRLRELRPHARIIHEINAEFYGNRIDVLAVGEAEIIAVEIKSAKDKLDRLPDQIKAMRKCAHHVIAALHEKFLVVQETNPFMSEFERDGKHWLRVLPEQARRVETWVYPDVDRKGVGRWSAPAPGFNWALPASAIHMLWRDELLSLCGELRISMGRRATMGDMLHALLWHCTGAELTHGICRQLRRRDCIEADAPVNDNSAPLRAVREAIGA